MQKKIFIILIFLNFAASFAKANNILINNVSLTDQHLGYRSVKFDISWDNSWRTSSAPFNWDAAWVFVKYRLSGSHVWKHATLNINAATHTAPAGSTITPSLDGKGVFMYRNSNGTGANTWNNAQLRWDYGFDNLQDYDSVEVRVFGIEMVYVPQGAFYVGDYIGRVATISAITAGSATYIPGVYNNVPFTGGSGTGFLGDVNVNGLGVISSITVTDGGSRYQVGNTLTPSLTVQNGGTPPTVNVATINGIAVGSGTIHGNFEEGSTGHPFQITGEGSINLGGGSAGSLGNNNTSGMSTVDDFNNTTSTTLPASYPKGYNAFYMMKYEITQGQYAAFLSTLTYRQQSTQGVTPSNPLLGRTIIQAAEIVGAGAMQAGHSYRSVIEVGTQGIDLDGSSASSGITPAVYQCDMNDNNIFNEANDGENVACNYLSWADLAAYLDWSALRPFTDLEFEKAARGAGMAVVPAEYAWGNTSLTCNTSAGNHSNGGLINETPGLAGANCQCQSNNSAGLIRGPLRVGAFAGAATSRTQSGASYYGVMDLSGNLWEMIVTVGHASGRPFTGLHGDGKLTIEGDANVSNWPIATRSSSVTTFAGVGVRGSAFISSYVSDYLRISDRYMGSSTAILNRAPEYGGRGLEQRLNFYGKIK